MINTRKEKKRNKHKTCPQVSSSSKQTQNPHLIEATSGANLRSKRDTLGIKVTSLSMLDRLRKRTRLHSLIPRDSLETSNKLRRAESGGHISRNIRVVFWTLLEDADAVLVAADNVVGHVHGLGHGRVGVDEESGFLQSCDDHRDAAVCVQALGFDGADDGIGVFALRGVEAWVDGCGAGDGGGEAGAGEEEGGEDGGELHLEELG